VNHAEALLSSGSKLPSKQSGKATPEEVEKIRQKLQQYLFAIANSQEIRSSTQFIDFIQMPTPPDEPRDSSLNILKITEMYWRSYWRFNGCRQLTAVQRNH
jgi:hypothetical protein